MQHDKNAVTSRLICAVKLGGIREVRSLIDSLRLSSSLECLNAKDDTGKSLLYYATRYGHLKMVRLLLTNGADLVKDNFQLLHVAVEFDYLKMIDLFLKYGADINATDENGRTVLHAVVKVRRIIHRSRITRFLFSRGADINAQTLAYNVNSKTRRSKHDCGNTALHIACSEGHHLVLEELLRCGAKIDARNEMYMTPLHFAAQVRYPSVTEVLLKFGAGVDFRDKYGRTALHFAVDASFPKNVVNLLQHGADINIQSEHLLGTPLYYIANKSIPPYHESNRAWTSRPEIIEILKCHMVKMNTANLYVNKIDLLSLGNTSNYSSILLSLLNKCKLEVASLRSEKINNTNVSFYDILTHRINRLALYARNEKIVQVLTSDDYKVKFPVYANMIECNFRKGKMRNELLKASHKCFPELPSFCTEKIFIYLNHEDLLVLIEAFKKQSLGAD